MPAPDDALDLLDFAAAGPSPVHVVVEIGRRLESAGFRRLDERDEWRLAPGDRRYVVRDHTSVVGFCVGRRAPADSGYRLIGAHTDSPTFKVRPRPDVNRHGLRLVGVERYGSPLLHTWMDRDLGVAGRLAVGDAADVVLVDVRIDAPVLRIPSLAVHLDREVNERLSLNVQQHVVPVVGVDDGPALLDLVAGAAGVSAGDVLGHDLVLTDVTPPTVGGADDRFVFSPRLDNLSSCHAGVTALTRRAHADADTTAVLVACDHEEVGSGSAEGAAGAFLDSVLRRISLASGSSGQAHERAVARSLLVSCDTAHAVHPNYPDRHEPGHRPVLNGGPVLKVNADERYATDAGTGGWFAARCDDAGVDLQHFVTRGDLPCGSTIGPLTATRTGVPTVDVGAPILSMHSIREQAGADDVAALTAALVAHLTAPGEVRPS